MKVLALLLLTCTGAAQLNGRNAPYSACRPEWLTNAGKLRPSKRNPFIYAGLLYKAANREADFLSYSTNVIGTFAVLQIFPLIIYGPLGRVHAHESS
jgi:hypothetical protein